jgi:hypothetical protein
VTDPVDVAVRVAAALNDLGVEHTVGESLAREQKAKWAAGFLGGRAKAFAKGNVPHAHGGWQGRRAG